MRPVALAFGTVALVVAAAACRAESGATEPPPQAALALRPSEPAPEVTAASAPAPAPSDAPAPSEPAAPSEAPALAATTSTVAAAAKAERDCPPAGCIDWVEELPDAPFLRKDDRRLSRDHLVVVSKSARRLMLFERGRSVACYRVALGFAPDGHKSLQGDGRTPEGWYRTSDKPWSSFDNAIAIHYPNADDARAAADDGRIGKRTRDTIVSAIDGGKVPPQATKLGGAVLIHGGGSSFDWTLGCVALDDDELLAFRELLPKGMRTDLLIVP